MKAQNNRSLKSRIAYIKNYRQDFRRYMSLLISPLLLAIILLIAVFFISTEQLKAKGNVTAERFAAQITGIFDEVSLMANSLKSDDAFIDNISQRSADDVDRVTLSEALSERSASQYINRVYFISDRQQYIYSESVYVYDSLPLILATIANIDTDTEEFDLADIKEDSLQYADGWHFLTYRNSYPYYITHMDDRNGEPCGVLLVALDMSQFLRTLYQGNQDVDFFCIYRDDASITSLMTATPGVDWQNDGEISELVGKNVRSFSVENDFASYLVAISLREYYYPLYLILGIFLAYFFLVLVFGTAKVLKLAREHYESIAALVDGLPQTGNPDNSSTRELIASVKRSLNGYRDMSLQYDELIKVRNLRQYLTKSSEYAVSEDTLNSIGLTGKFGGFCIAQFAVYNTDITGPYKITLEVTTLILASLLRELGGERCKASVTDVTDTYCGVFCLSEDFYGSAEFREILERVMQVSLENYGIEMRVAVSSYCADFSAASDAFAEALDTLSFADAVGSTALVVFSGEKMNTAVVAGSGDFLKETQVLSSTLIIGRYDMIPSMVETIINEHIIGESGNAALIRRRMSCLANILSEALLSLGLPEENTVTYIRKLNSCTTPETMISAVNLIFSDSLSKSDASGSTIERARAYIDEHIADPNLSVSEVVDAMGVSFQHLSRLFRQNMDTTMLEYINRTRIELAKKALTDTDSNVNNIAERVGFQSKTTFIRNFQRYTGVTPTEYRAANR